MKFILFLSLLSSCTQLSAEEFIPEASAVTRVKNSVIIAGDEEPKHLWVRNGNSEPVKTAVKGAEWNDLEGLASVDDKSFYAMTSHGLTKKGKRKPEREKLMLISNEGAMTVKKSWSLREDILQYLHQNLSPEINFKEVSSAVPDEGGLNVEGLAYQSGKLIMGLRSPVTKTGEAIILVFSVADQKFISHQKLKLDGKGIRSLETSEKGILVISGSTNDSQETFGLHLLDLQNGKVVSKKASGFEKLLRPEGVTTLNSGSLLLVQDFEAQENQNVIQELPGR